jgi:hypothetical protein
MTPLRATAQRPVWSYSGQASLIKSFQQSGFIILILIEHLASVKAKY